MSVITVSAGIFTTYAGDEVTLKMRIFCRKTFTKSTGGSVVRGRVGTTRFYDEVDCTVAAGVVSHAGFTIDSTSDGVPATSYYSFALFTDAGKHIDTPYRRIEVSASPTTTTFDALVNYTLADGPVADERTYTRTVIDAMFAALTNMATKMTEAIYGAGKLSVPAANPAIPIVVGANDPVIGKVYGNYAKASLPASSVAGRLARLTDDNKGLWFDTGSQWVAANGRRYDVTAFGATGDGSTDDTVAIQAAITAAMSSQKGGTVYFPRPDSYYKCTGVLNLDGAFSVTLEGTSAPSGLGGTTAGALVYTGAASSFISARGSQGCSIRGMRILYTAAGFTGDVVDFSGSGSDTAFTLIDRCEIRGENSSADNARCAVLFNQAIIAWVTNSQFTYCDVGILGKTIPGYSNVINIINNTFLNLGTAACKNGGEQWNIAFNTCEHTLAGKAGLYTEDLQGFSINFDNNWCGDATVAGTPWIRFTGNRMTASANFFGDAGASQDTIIIGVTAASMDAIDLSGNIFSGVTGSAISTTGNGSIQVFNSFGDRMIGGTGTYYTDATSLVVAKNIIGRPISTQRNELTEVQIQNSFLGISVNAAGVAARPSLNHIGANEDLAGTAYALAYITNQANGNVPHQFYSGAASSLRFAINDVNTSYVPLVFGADNTLDIGAVGATRPRTIHVGSGVVFSEQSAPSAPAADSVVLFAQDNGAGKTQLMARFATGAVQQVAIEP